MGKLSTFITRLKQTLTKIGEDVKDLRDNKADISDIPTEQQIDNWNTAYDWGDFRDYGLGGYVNLGNIGTNGFDTTANETGFYYAQGIDTSILGSLNVKLIQLGSSSISSNVGQIIMGHSGANRIAFRNNQSNTFSELYHTGNFNPAQYVLQTDLNTQLNNYVTVNSSQSITGTKTFTAAPIVPNGTLNGHTVNLGQLNDAIANIDLTGYATESWVSSQGFLTSVSWSQVSGKPTTFPPSAHTHEWSQITNKPTSFPPSTHTHSAGDINSGVFSTSRIPSLPISKITNLQDELNNKANTDGSNTIGGEWNIDVLKNDDLGAYVSADIFSNEKIGIIPTSALGSAYGLLLMKHGKPLAIAENADINWDGYIYRVGTPLPGYPGNQQNGNYLIESKHRFRLHSINAPDSTSGGEGFLTVQPFNAIEHSYFRVTISGVELLTIDMKAPNFDEITGFAIERNAIGQKCTVAVSGGVAGVKFTSVSGANFSTNWNKGVFEFYWTGTGWIFGGYSPIEP